MEILIAVVIGLIILIIYSQLKPEKIYRTSPANPNYDMKYVTITFIGDSIDGVHKNIEHQVCNIFYITKKMKPKDACVYIFKHKELYIDDLDKIKCEFNKKFNTELRVNKIIISVDNI